MTVYDFIAKLKLYLIVNLSAHKILLLFDTYFQAHQLLETFACIVIVL